jgi:hypothetical protein
MTERLLDLCLVVFGERVDEMDALDPLSVLKIFADWGANSGASYSSPKHSVPESQPVRPDSADSLDRIGGRAGLHKHDGSPAFNEGCCRAPLDPGFARHGAKNSQRVGV